MINFSGIKQETFWGKILRFCLKFIPRQAVLPIIQGPLRGSRWIVNSGVFGYWLGSYEIEKKKSFASLIKKSDVVYDLGAHVGFYSLLAAKFTGDAGRVFSFEPLPRNIILFRQHVMLNRIKNIKLVEAGVSDRDSFSIFENPTKSSSVGRINDDALGISVRLVTIDSLLAKSEILPPQCNQNGY